MQEKKKNKKNEKKKGRFWVGHALRLDSIQKLREIALLIAAIAPPVSVAPLSEYHHQHHLRSS